MKRGAAEMYGDGEEEEEEEEDEAEEHQQQEQGQGQGQEQGLEQEDEEEEQQQQRHHSQPSKRRKPFNPPSLDPFQVAAATSSPHHHLSPSHPLSDYDEDLHPSPSSPPPPPPPIKSSSSAKKTPSKRKASIPRNAHSDDEGAPQVLAVAGEPGHRAGNPSGGKAKEEEEDEEENLEIELGKCQTVDPEKMQAVLAQFTPEQMSRYECYRRSGFQKSIMRRLLQNVAGCPISMPMTIVMSGIAKMFVGELVEIGRIVMTERKESGPIRPCHIREAYRRLKLKGKVPLRTRPRLFR